MARILALAALIALGTTSALAAERVNLRPAARVCDATDCFTLDARAVAVTVWQSIGDGSIQFRWKGALLTATADAVDRDVQECGWGEVKGERAFLCDGEPHAPLAEAAPLPRRGWSRRPDPEIVAILKSTGVYRHYYQVP